MGFRVSIIFQKSFGKRRKIYRGVTQILYDSGWIYLYDYPDPKPISYRKQDIRVMYVGMEK